ncbi:ATP-binding cassette domain-containing protein [Bacteroidetes/Chlorobi group bacterium ChocPot_Mid]|jgi:phospholipid/cholesterol/gamma-HCH transport system ATP-binding protein|nr:MAG: ATP-binding cassette domain-containing protein [Bacteroidetes/Chlorobi group bacterium ChocPot_Mid]
MTGKPIIEVKNLSVVYGERTILKDINLEVYRGEIFVIVGGSGCGKSTLLRQIIGIERPSEGTIIINGEDLTASEGDKRRKILQNFGVMFQSGGLFASMDIGDNIGLMLESYTKVCKERIDDLIDLNLSAVGLRGYENYYPSELSGGMKKRAAIARAMIMNPSIMCFDEPASGLDPINAASLDELIKDLNRSLGTTMLVVTHDLSSILNISDRIIMLDAESKGIIAQGTPGVLKNYTDNEYVYKFFNRKT